jgi:flagellar hook-associated protein 2
MASSGINFSGLGSGIDTESIIKQLIQVQQRPIQLLQQRQSNIRQQQVALAQFNAAVSGLKAAATTLDSSSTYEAVTTSVSDSSVATATVGAGAQAGSYTLKVNQLAKSHRIASTPLTSQTDALGVGGEFVVNGKTIRVAVTDSLQNIAANINASGAGVQAGIISQNSNSFTLTLTSSKTGAENTINLSDVGSGVILGTTLGLVSGATTVSHPTTNGAQTRLFSDSATSIGSQLGMTTPPSGTIQINGTNVSLDFGVDSLTGISTKINAAGITGVTASIVSETDKEGTTRSRLKITGATTPTFTDSNHLLENIGVLQKGYGNQLAAGADANFEVNGLALTRSSNTVSDAVNGVTINLLTDKDTPTTTIDIVADISTIKQQITSFTNAYNFAASTLASSAAFDPDTLASGPLFGDVTTQNVLNSFTNVLADSISGLSGNLSVLGHAGITLSNAGQIQVDDAALTKALSDNLQGVARIFRGIGIPTNNSVNFVSSTNKTQPSGSGGYEVAISQLATRATAVGGTTHTTSDNASSETLTFNGDSFGTAGYNLLISPNVSMDDIVSLINADTTLTKYVAASNSGGKLSISSKQYGAIGNFKVTSNQAAAGNNSGVGTTAIEAVGLDVAGTIGGESATGKGQFLTGDASNTNTSGLQLRITSITTGSQGFVAFTKGYANLIKELGSMATDTFTGTLSAYSNDLSTQVDDMAAQITDIQSRLKDEETRLRIQFTTMDSAVARIKSQANSLAALTSG